MAGVLRYSVYRPRYRPPPVRLWTGTAGATFPVAPHGLTAVAQSDTEILVSWDAVAGADAYDVERDSVIVEAKTTLLSFSDTGLTPSTEYEYRVRAARQP